MELLKEVGTFIEGSLKGSHVDLRLTSSDRVVGRIVWDGFDNQEQIDRQRYISNLLREHFEAQAASIGILLAYTPHELRVMQSA